MGRHPRPFITASLVDQLYKEKTTASAEEPRENWTTNRKESKHLTAITQINITMGQETPHATVQTHNENTD